MVDVFLKIQCWYANRDSVETKFLVKKISASVVPCVGDDVSVTGFSEFVVHSVCWSSDLKSVGVYLGRTTIVSAFEYLLANGWEEV